MTFIYYIIVYNVLFILGFYIANEVRFVGNSIIYSWVLIPYLGLLSLIEVFGSYFILFKKDQRKIYIKFTFVSYAIMGVFLIVFILGFLG